MIISLIFLLVLAKTSVAWFVSGTQEFPGDTVTDTMPSSRNLGLHIQWSLRIKDTLGPI